MIFRASVCVRLIYFLKSTKTNGISLSFTRNALQGETKKVLSLTLKFSLFAFVDLGTSSWTCEKSVSFWNNCKNELHLGQCIQKIDPVKFVLLSANFTWSIPEYIVSFILSIFLRLKKYPLPGGWFYLKNSFSSTSLFVKLCNANKKMISHIVKITVT